jgi:uncharacterized protein
MSELGVGLVFVPALLPLLHDAGAVPVLEIEPQTLWQLSYHAGTRSYFVNRERLEELAALPQRKLMHSVGLPVGGGQPMEGAQLRLLSEMREVLAPAWISEHLSFNAFHDGNRWVSAGFFLPPQQTEATVRVAAAKLATLRTELGRPVAFETGVNYLRPVRDDLADGDFFRAVAEAADCGILLDLHNVWTNERNGRQRVVDLLAQLPLERVWEIHVAGGMDLNGYWLDSHSDTVPEPVLDLAAEWIPLMPNVRAIIFEIRDEAVQRIGLEKVTQLLDRLHAIWKLRRTDRTETRLGAEGAHFCSSSSQSRTFDALQTRRWETALGSLVTGHPVAPITGDVCSQDPGIDVLRTLIAEARASSLSEGLRHTMTLLIATLGPARVRCLVDAYGRSCPPELYVSAECHAFTQFLKAQTVDIPYLSEVLNFEHALIRATLLGETRRVEFEHDPMLLFDSLASGQLPRGLPQQPSSIVVSPE